MKKTIICFKTHAFDFKRGLSALRFFAFVVAFLTLTANSAWGQSTTYTFTSKAWASAEGNWTKSSDGNSLATGQGVQITTGFSGLIICSPTFNSNISKVEVSYCTNATAGVGTISAYYIASASTSTTGTQIGSTFNVTKPSSGGTTLKTATFTPASGTVSGYVQIKPTCTTNSLYIYSVTITISNPTITTPSPTSLSGFTTTAGTASASQTFTVGGSNLTADLVVTAPSNYEVRENGSGSFGSSVSFTPSSGTVEKTIEVRIAASAAVGSPSGNVVCSSTGATSQNVAVSGTVSALSYSITPTSNNESFGTVSLSGAVITGAPASGYTYATPAYTVLSGTATVSQNGNNFTVTPTSNCAIRINFEAIPTYTVTFDKGTGNCATTSLTESIGGAGVTLPTATPSASCIAQNWEFAGWATAAQSESTTAPTLYAAGTTYNPVSNTTLYAVYKVTVSGSAVTTSETSFSSQNAAWTVNQSGGTSYWKIFQNNYILSPEIDLSTLSKVEVQMGTFGTVASNSDVLSIQKNGTADVWATKQATSNSENTLYTITEPTTPLSGTGKLKLVSLGATSSVGLRVSSVKITYSATSSTITYNSNPSCTNPLITVSATTLSGFTYAQGSGPSAEQSFTVSGVNLTNDISIAAPTNYEISKTSGSGYATPLTFTPAEVATAQTVYVRLKSGLSQGAYNNEVINVTSTGADAKTVTVSGSVTEQINAEPSAHATGFAAVEDGQNAIILSWTDASGADGYLIKASAVSYAAIAAPVDGTPESDAALVKNVAQGTAIVEFTGLAASTTYYFKIWPYSNSGASIDYKTDGSVPQASTMTDAIVRPNVIITEVYGGGGNTGATFKNDFIELYNTTNSPIDISGWSIQYYSATGTTPGTDGSNVHTFPSGSIIPAKSHFLIQQAAGTGGTADLFEPNVSGTLAISGTGGKVILFTTNTAQTITSDISSVTGHVNFKDYLPFGASTPVWGSAMSATTNTTSATRKKVSGEYVYSQNIGNDFEAVTPTPQNSGKYRTKGSGNLNDNLNWEFTDNGTWIDVASAPDNNGRGVEIEAGHEMTINANASLSAVTLKPGAKLTLNNGHSFSPGTFTLESNASATATFVDKRTHANKTDITATVQQHLPAASTRTWWYLASPVTGAASSVFGSNKVGDYSETTRSYSSPFATPTTLTAGKGYVVKMTAASAANYVFENKTLNTGDISVLLTRTVTETADNAKRGFNLVGNPYPSYIDWDYVYLEADNVRSTIWYRTLNGASMEFHTYNAELGVGSPTTASEYIPPMQAFWVKVDTDPVSPATVSNGTLNFTNDMRSHDESEDGNPLKAPAADRQLVRLNISNGTLSDETVIATHPSASDSYDRFDSEKMANGDTNRPEIFSMAGSQELVINGISPLTDSKQIALGVRPGRAGNYTISLTEWRNTGNMEAVLRDNQLGEELILTESNNYSFDTDGSTSTSRFSLLFRAKGSNTGFDRISSDLLIYASQKSIRVESASLEGNTISIFNALGQPIFNGKAQSNRLEINGLTPAVYLVKVNHQTKMVIVK